MATIAVIGSGAVGSFYGGLLARAGHHVRFLMRRDLEAVRANGLDIRSKDGDFFLPDPKVYGNPHEIGQVDWVICSLKATALDEAYDLIRPCVGDDTRIVAFMNGLGIEDRFAGWFDGDRVFGAMAFVCINRGQPGVVHHLDYGRVSIGHYRDDQAEAQRLYDILAPAGVEAIVAPNLLYARWEKLCWNVPFSGLTVAAGGIDTRAILDTPSLCNVVREAIAEIVAAGNADLAAQGSDARIDPAAMTERMFAQTETMGAYRPSMLIDYLQRQPMETEAILGAPVRRARELGVPVPTVSAIYAMVQAAGLRNGGTLRALKEADLVIT